MKEKTVQVAAGIIRKNDLILIAQRKNDSWLEPNKWEFPGGKVEQFENVEECLVREIKEELGIEIIVEKLLMVHSNVYKKENKDYPVQLYVYLASWKQGEVKNIDCQDSRWVSPDEIEEFDFVEADKPIMKELLKRLKMPIVDVEERK